MEIRSISDFRVAVRSGPYAWPGGYPTYFICDDGASLCCRCANEDRRRILESVAHKQNDGWRVVALEINWENADLFCDHCSGRIESAYAEPEETG